MLWNCLSDVLEFFKSIIIPKSPMPRERQVPHFYARLWTTLGGVRSWNIAKKLPLSIIILFSHASPNFLPFLPVELPFKTFLLYYFLICSRLEYAWYISHWTLRKKKEKRISKFKLDFPVLRIFFHYQNRNICLTKFYHLAYKSFEYFFVKHLKTKNK